jgi:hypothetical protein
MSAEAAIYPTSNSVSNRFSQNRPNQPTKSARKQTQQTEATF